VSQTNPAGSTKWHDSHFALPAFFCR